MAVGKQVEGEHLRGTRAMGFSVGFGGGGVWGSGDVSCDVSRKARLFCLDLV